MNSVFKMNFASVYERQKRPTQMFHPMHSSVANYWTETLQKSELQQEYGDVNYLNSLHLIPDPLKKNLADTLITNEKSKKMPEKMPEKTEMPLPKVENTGTTALGGIGSFFSGVFNVLSGVMFRTRLPGYYGFVDARQGAPESWHNANTDVQDKNGNGKSYDAPTDVNVSLDMNTANPVTNCETELNQVLNLLTPKQSTSSKPVWVRKRPKKVFVEPNSVSESFEDAFSPEDFINLPEEPFYSCCSPMQYQKQELCETAAQKTKLNEPIKENMEIVKDVRQDLDLKKELLEKSSQLDKDSDNHLESKLDNIVVEQKSQLDCNNERKLEMDNSDKIQTENPADTAISINCQLVSTCEDKLSKLKALLLEKRKKTQTESVPDMETMESHKPPADKHYKNPNRRTNKRRKSKMRCKIEDDLLFANEISVGTPPSVENSPREHNVNFGDYFDELKGRFRSTSIGSEDSFQIVFNDSPKQGRIRTTSDCDSEDSFIVFEDSPDSCYLSNDVFGSDSELSDSGCVETCKLSHSLTRTVSNLADDSLYAESEDEVDFAEKLCENENTGLLLDDKKKQLRKNLPMKKVHFSAAPPKVHVMRVWAFAARQARAGHWERYAIDRERFKRRIVDVEMAISWALRPQHRSRVMFQRFMPWWNQQKRKELAEKKEEEARRLADEAKKLEEDINKAQEEVTDIEVGNAINAEDSMDEQEAKNVGVKSKMEEGANILEEKMAIDTVERKLSDLEIKDQKPKDVKKGKELKPPTGNISNLQIDSMNKVAREVKRINKVDNKQNVTDDKVKSLQGKGLNLDVKPIKEKQIDVGSKCKSENLQTAKLNAANAKANADRNLKDNTKEAEKKQIEISQKNEKSIDKLNENKQLNKVEMNKIVTELTNSQENNINVVKTMEM